MDLQTPLICAGVVAVTSAAVYLSSVFGMKERTYEEAIEEQRRRNSLDISLKPNKTVDKPKKEKKEKKKEKLTKKDKPKDKSSIGAQQQSTEPKPTVKESVRKTEHAVGFKAEPEVVLWSEDSESVDISKQRKPSYDKPIKPILLNKSDQNIDLSQVLNESVNGRNSFDQILPKDDLELMKHYERSLDSEPTVEPVVEEPIVYNTTTVPLASSATNYNDNDLSHQHMSSETDSRVAEVLRIESSENSSPARKSRKSKQNSLEGRLSSIICDNFLSH
ncbi:unnamed protein product [Medioppia subpectinata]|uniref:Uncharacterized protein n=1 Tax=Medioppia subpectinata TaxID=1979941 RepID=A0A7R9PXQ6_9ACAR|nr:unnamed protein product [Medioppia subpectinata]CAG2104630.1 unnamed protein product [Medioppia subpectinata]